MKAIKASSELQNNRRLVERLVCLICSCLFTVIHFKYFRRTGTSDLKQYGFFLMFPMAEFGILSSVRQNYWLLAIKPMFSFFFFFFLKGGGAKRMGRKTKEKKDFWSCVLVKFKNILILPWNSNITWCFYSSVFFFLFCFCFKEDFQTFNLYF